LRQFGEKTAAGAGVRGTRKFVTERHLRPATRYAISTDLRLFRGEALSAITLRNSYRVDWTVVIEHVTAVVTPTAEGNDRSVRKNPVTDR
jgi:hypothetical protein